MASNNRKNPAPSHNGKLNGTLLGLIFLGICILIAGFSIGGNLKKVSKTITETNFSDSNTYNAPSEINYGMKKYLTESEAAEYLNLTTEKIVELIRTGEITEYVNTDKGYSISVAVLDAWFDNEAYQNKLKANQPAEQ